jgi:uncharacterized protein YqeY
MLKEKLTSLIAEAMKDNNKNRLKVLRLIKSEYQKFETSGKDKKLTDADEITILKKLRKQWMEEIQLYRDANRDVTELSEELTNLDGFVPEELSEDKQYAIIQAAMDKYFMDIPVIERKSMKHLGAVMKIIKQTYPIIEGKKVSEVYKEILGM